jgi:hypothetical protein
MLGAILGLAFLAGGPAGPDPAALVEELGSPRYLRREAAEAALTRLGRGALPSLRAALDARDPEVRIRALAILTRIEGTLLVQPTPVAFDFREVPIVDAIRAINHQAELSLKLQPENDPAWAESRLTLHTVEPLPFWKGVDALCEAGGLHYNFGVQQAAGRREQAFPLYHGYVPPPEPVSDSGPFRTHLASVHYQSEIQLSRPRPATAPRGDRPASLDEGAHVPSVATRQFYLQFQMAAEPRLSITQNGAPKVIEAIDDLGKSLQIPGPSATILRSSGYFGMNPSSLVRFRVDLVYPETSHRRIKRIKGAMPVIVATRKPDPLKVPLEGATGKSFRSADVDLSIREVRAARDGQPAAIELTLKPLGGSVSQTADEVDPMAARLESPQEQLEVLDANDQPIAWFPSSSFFNGEETRLTLSLLTQGTLPPRPSTIAYHGMSRVATEVPFEFRDVPIP